MTAMAKVATTGVLALIGLMVVKFVLGMLGVALGFAMFLLFKVVPLALVIALVIWLFKKGAQAGSPA